MNLTDLSDSTTVSENTANATPQLLDADVTFTDTGAGYNGGTLKVSGLLAEDRVSIASGAVIYLDGTTVMYDADGAGGGAAVAIGTASGGSGATFTVTFNGNASAAAIELLIESLTYANVSDTPTASRTLTIDVTDATGDDLSSGPSVTAQTGAANPFDGVDLGMMSHPSFADLDGDGDLDAVMGSFDGLVAYFENTGTASAPVFTQRTGAANPFNGIDIGYYSKPTLGDLDGDGDLDVVMGQESGALRYFENTGTAQAATFTERTGAANPFNGVDVGLNSSPVLVDLDGDGDLDAVIGEVDGVLNYFENTGTAQAATFTERTGAANPFNGFDVGYQSVVGFADLDGDGDLDAFAGENHGTLTYFENTGTASAPVFVQRTGASNPFNGTDVGFRSAPSAFADLDNDGDPDAVVGEQDGVLNYFENTTVRGQAFTVNVTAQNDAPSASGVPTDVTATEDTASNLDLSAISVTDAEGDSLTVVLTASAGTMAASSGGGVTVTNSGTGAITLTGTASAIDTFLNTASNIQYTGAANASGNNAATITITANDGSGAVTLGTVNVDITNVNDAPTLTGLATSATFNENTVNATPQLLDVDVTFDDVDGNFDGGALTVSGLLAEDRISVASGSTISLDGTTVYYDADGAGGSAAVAIGTASGGSGATFTVTFNSAATSAAVDALIQNLTYANVSNTPTASRTLTINVTDAAGDDLSGEPSFTERTGASNPFNGVNVGFYSAPTFADLDGDGDLDAVVGEFDGTLNYFENTGSAAAPAFTQRTGDDNPFNGVDVGNYNAPALTDLDGDGDLDLVIGRDTGTFVYFENTGDAIAAVFAQQAGPADPFDGIDVGARSTPIFFDVDGDGDLDMVAGERDGAVNYFENTGTAATPQFTERTGGDNPFAAVGGDTAPSLVDMDGDGDLDALIGQTLGGLIYFENTGTAMAPVFTLRTGADNPFNGVDVGGSSTPTFADLDNDGDLDAVLGESDGVLNYFENTTVNAPSITVNVTAQNDAPTASGLPTDITVTEDTAGNLNLSAVTLADADGDSLTVVLTASAGTMTATSGGGVTVTNSGTGAITLTGTASAIDTFLNTASNIQYTGAANVNGDNAATITVSANDGSGAVTLGTVNIDITAVDDPMSLTGLSTSVTFNENTVNATPQLLDADVSFVHADNDYDGGTLTVSGLLAEDRISIASGATISLDGTTVYYDADGAGGSAAVAIGTASGGLGATFTVTFNSAATSAAVDALIQNLTYANVSNTPTASRDIVVNVTDASGGELTGPPSFTERTGGANPFNGVSVGQYSTPAFADLDGDGDLDAAVGDAMGTLHYFENTGTASAPVFIERTLGDNPLGGVNLDFLATPTFVDLDNDGDLDIVIGENSGYLYYFENTGTALAPAFDQRTDGDNPFNGIFGGDRSSPAFADIDGDGDLDAVVGELFGQLVYLENTGTAASPTFVQRTGGANPFNDVDAGYRSKPTFADLDGDGDIDLLLGESYGSLVYYENTGTTEAPAFTLRSGSDNPLNGVDVGVRSAPTFADLDNDGDQDVVVGDLFGALVYLENTTAPGRTITVNVTAQNDAPSATGVPTDVTVTEDVASNLDLSAISLADPDAGGTITVTLTASAGILAATAGGGVSVDSTLANVMILTGTPSAIDTFLNTASNITYTGASNVNGNDVATITITANDGSGAVTLGTVNVDITAVDDPMTLTDIRTAISFNENTVNATPQLLDASVTFVHGDNSYSGGTLVVSGLLAEDRVSIASGAVISLSAGTVYYDADGSGSGVAVAIGTASGGSGATFTVTFNSAATSTAIDLLIESLTYANVSDTPTKDRTLTLQVTDAIGDHLATAVQILVGVTAEADGPTGGADTFTGTTGADTVKGLGGNDTLDGGDGNDTVEGGDGDDVLTGGAGNDRLDGGAGADGMTGGTGDDIYYVNNAGDVVDETGGDGYDTVRTTISYTLTAGVEQLELLFSSGINGTGNALDNVIVGNGGANVLSGLAGDDTITGGSGNDTLNGGDDNDSLDGGAGNDTLNGGAGIDTLVGGAGNDRLDGGANGDAMTGGAGGDTYIVDHADDTVTELAGGGTDSVEASVTHGLSDNVENLLLTGGSAIDGNGNALANTITGNGAANVLSGGAGADVLSGLGGNDRLLGDAGSDTLSGGLGADTFVFSNADIGTKVETDKILDLVFGDGDVVDLSGIDANSLLGGNQAFTWVTKFSKAAGQALMTYANGVTTIALDVNGDGKADFKLTINGDHTGTKANLYTGGGDTDGGWIL